MTHQARFALLRAMKFLIPALATTLLASCNSELYRHEKDFSTKHRKGAWVEYRQQVLNGQKPEPKKELKDR